MLYLLLLGSVAFAEYNGYSVNAKYALGLILLIGLFSYVYTNIISRKTTAKLIYDASYVTEKEKISFKINFDCPLPHTLFSSLITIYDSDYKMLTTAIYNEKTRNEFSYQFNELGKYYVTLDKIIIKGFFNLYSKKLDLSENKHEILIYPATRKFDYKKLDSFIYRSEGELVNRPGNDFTEVYEIKEFEEGDDIRHIHNTLTTDERIMVKVGSLEIKEVYIYNLKKVDNIEKAKNSLREIAYLYNQNKEIDEYFFIDYLNNTYEINDLYSYSVFINKIYEEFKIC